jgi:ABC-type nitrate/sulfonate/bicarbonate transport system ATPase subunit
MMPQLSLTGHIIAFRDGPPLQAPITLSLTGGGRLGITGPSGCGKTTLLRQIAGSASSQASPQTISVGAAVMNYLPQHGFLFPWYTPRRNYMAWLRRSVVRPVDLETACQLGISDALDQSLSSLSGGQRQRVGLWLVLASDANLLLLDEPFTALDMARKFVCLEALGEWLKIAGRSLVLVSHDFEVLSFLSERVLLLTQDGSSPSKLVELNGNLPCSRADYLTRHRGGEYEKLLIEMVAPLTELAPIPR